MGLTLVKADSYALDDLVRSGSMEAFNLVAASNSLHEPLHPKHVPMLGIGVSKSDPHLTNLTNPTKHPNRESFNPTLATISNRSTCPEIKISGSVGGSSHEKLNPTDLTEIRYSQKQNLRDPAKSQWDPSRSGQISSRFRWDSASSRCQCCSIGLDQNWCCPVNLKSNRTVFSSGRRQVGFPVIQSGQVGSRLGTNLT